MSLEHWLVSHVTFPQYVFWNFWRHFLLSQCLWWRCVCLLITLTGPHSDGSLAVLKYMVFLTFSSSPRYLWRCKAHLQFRTWFYFMCKHYIIVHFAYVPNFTRMKHVSWEKNIFPLQLVQELFCIFKKIMPTLTITFIALK